jgi:hypothetical protein
MDIVIMPQEPGSDCFHTSGSLIVNNLIIGFSRYRQKPHACENPVPWIIMHQSEVFTVFYWVINLVLFEY